MRRHYAAWFFIASVSFCAFLVAQRPAPAPRAQDFFDFIPAPEMQKHFAEFNKKYFGNRLPKNTDVEWSLEELRLEGYMGLTLTNGDGGFTILLDVQMKNIGYTNAAEETLLHEMVHCDEWPCMGHGKCFQDDMLRLARSHAFDAIW